jgi:hypothetical protein
MSITQTQITEGNRLEMQSKQTKNNNDSDRAIQGCEASNPLLRHSRGRASWKTMPVLPKQTSNSFEILPQLPTELLLLHLHSIIPELESSKKRISSVFQVLLFIEHCKTPNHHQNDNVTMVDDRPIIGGVGGNIISS